MEVNKIWNKQYVTLFSLNVILSTSFFMVSTTLSKHLVQLGMTVAVAGTIIGMMPLAALLMRPFSGWISDRFNKRSLLFIFLSIYALCMLAYGLVTSELAFLVIRFLHGISFSMTSTISMALIVGFIPKDRMGEGLGYFGIAQTIAMAVGPSIGLALLQFSTSQWMFLFASVSVVVAMGTLFYLPNVRPKELERERQALRLRLSDFFVKEAIIFSVITFALSSTNGIENSFIALYGIEFGMLNVGWYFTLSAVFLLLSRVFLSKVGDRKGFSFVFYPGVLCIVFSFLLLSSATATNAVYIFAVAAILKAIGIGAVQPAVQASVMKNVSVERRGAATSTFYVGADLGQATSPYIAGKMIDTSGYSDMFKFFAMPLIVVAALYGGVMWRRKRSGRQ